MSRIQINDLNSSDFGFLSELTDEEMSGINGGKWWWLAIAIVKFFFC
jgi:bacteriocin-like protein